MSENLIRLCVLYAQLSLLAFGGANTILPDMQRQIVDVNHFMTPHTFAALFALSVLGTSAYLMVVAVERALSGWLPLPPPQH